MLRQPGSLSAGSGQRSEKKGSRRVLTRHNEGRDGLCHAWGSCLVFLPAALFSRGQNDGAWPLFPPLVLAWPLCISFCCHSWILHQPHPILCSSPSLHFALAPPCIRDNLSQSSLDSLQLIPRDAHTEPRATGSLGLVGEGCTRSGGAGGFAAVPGALGELLFPASSA